MRLLGRLVAALGVLGAVALLLARGGPHDWPASIRDLPRWLGAAPVEARVVSFAALAAWGCLAWLAFVLVAVAVGAFPHGAVRDVAERVLGIAVVGVAAGALVAGPAAADGPFDRPAGSVRSPARSPATAPSAHPTPHLLPRATPSPPPPSRADVATPARPPRPFPPRHPGDGVVVVAGDTLWGIAARRLGDRTTPALIAATWPRWYAANRPLIGPDPDLIVPGQRLAPPNDGGNR